MLRLATASLLAFSAATSIAAPAKDDAEPVQVELVAEHTALVPGQAEQFGLLLRHQPHWHTYWVNPGDSGLPTTLEWTLPAGFQADAIAWPVPKRFEVGGLYNFGYDGETLLPISIAVPAEATVGSTVRATVTAKWLMCREECIPGKASLSIELPVVREDAKPDTRWIRQFSDARLAQPQATAWKASAREDGDRFVVTLSGPGLPPAAATLDAFVAQRKVFDNKPPTIRRDGDAVIVEAGKSEYFTTAPSDIELWLTADGVGGPRGWRVRAPLAANPPATAP
ncbi:protein-disulfide reductase DsbD domain-containing protein [Dokdonella sp.]|uniref:protein-disulfide reductase DsbD domain-containing protein n=1 Tax=Dokdonella sp. TaxID=2291710 RepID=UPI001B144A72|nr:protein-disulfide reductase DsbD domain-containing protein [Dokdonella sp.]MBO9661497.1 hypothetical protein [Dokdonella sp.]